MRATSDAGKNRRYWDRESDEYQRRHGEHLRSGAAWGVWQIPEDDLQVLGSVRGKDVLELGCGAAQWSVALAGRGACPVGLDNSRRQLRHAVANLRAAGVDFPLVHAGAERVPLPARAFDIVFCDHGAMSFADPRLTVPEVARLLRPGGLLAFNMSTPLRDICWNDRTERVDARLHEDYFGLHRWEDDAHVEFQLAYGEWIRLFRANGLVVEDLIELQAPEAGVTTYDYVSRRWARRWPSEHIWKARKGARGGRSR